MTINFFDESSYLEIEITIALPCWAIPSSVKEIIIHRSLYFYFRIKREKVLTNKRFVFAIKLLKHVFYSKESVDNFQYRLKKNYPFINITF